MFNSIELNEGTILVSFRDTMTLHVYGTCNITVLHGKLILNGYHCGGDNSPIHLSTSNLGPTIQVKSILSKSEKMNVPRVTKKLRDLKFNNIYFDEKTTELLSHSRCAIVIQGYALEDLKNDPNNWILYAEFSSFRSHQTLPKVSTSDDIDGVQLIGECCLFGMLEKVARSLNIELMKLPDSWKNSVDNMMGVKPSNNSTTISTTVDVDNDGGAIRSLVCGAKGVGKSTLLRYTINRILKRHDTVAVIDCDVGQPEFTVPGIVSLHLIRSSVLYPNYMNIKEPLSSHFIGDVNTKSDPQTVVTAIEKLIKIFKEYCLEKSKSAHEEYSNAASGNIFRALDEDNREVHSNIPLVVNTDGWIRYTGAEILSSIMKILNPTHVLHISTLKDQNLPALSIVPSFCKVMKLEVGSAIPSKVAPSDLRNLRLISYFLKNNSIISHLLEYYHDCYKCNSSTSTPLMIKNGSITDSTGMLCFAFRQAQIKISFKASNIRLIGNKVPSRLILSALNASLVGILNSNEHCIAVGYIFDLKVSDETSVSDNNTDNNSDDLHVVADMVIPPGLKQKVQHAMQSPQGVSIVKGYMQLPLVLQNAPWLSSFVYQSSEICGEGNTNMKARTNLKRRSHN